jgi:pectin methylesterase-like acyl-CoA thioesterase
MKKHLKLMYLLCAIALAGFTLTACSSNNSDSMPQPAAQPAPASAPQPAPASQPGS